MDREEALEWLQEKYPKLSQHPHIYESILLQCEKDAETGERLVPVEGPDGMKYGVEESKSLPAIVEEDPVIAVEVPPPESQVPPLVSPEEEIPVPHEDPPTEPSSPTTDVDLSVSFSEFVEIIEK